MKSEKTVTQIMAQNKICETPITHEQVDLPSWNPNGIDNPKPEHFDRKETND